MIAETKTIIYSIGIFIGYILTQLGIDIEIFNYFILLLFIDFITGFIKGLRLKNATSKKIWMGFLIKFSLLFIILSIGIYAKILGMNPDVMLGIAFFGLATAELYSILGNVYTIFTLKTHNAEYNAVANVLKFFMNLTKDNLEKEIKIEEKEIKEIDKV